MQATLDAPSQSRRVNARRPRDDANHHLWRNGHRWWIAFTVRLANGQRRRVRRSLGTTDVREARVLRDAIFDRARASKELDLAGGLAT